MKIREFESASENTSQEIIYWSNISKTNDDQIKQNRWLMKDMEEKIDELWKKFKMSVKEGMRYLFLLKLLADCKKLQECFNEESRLLKISNTLKNHLVYLNGRLEGFSTKIQFHQLQLEMMGAQVQYRKRIK
ncbi:hypothetical protein RF11_08581 [Thelohanellus kitauei]|uniref:Uncharacterized protein n=1 Tax=Thelohanellus kitauei TaxID=669202 RepID=A0A0C2MV70_THEKT|nr:hypothetical protein RF11_08581 [Thelohanellus kitauei]